MLRTAHRIALFATALLASVAFAGEPATTQSTTILGPVNHLLSDGSAALEAGRYEEGVRLTLAGLEVPNNKRDEASGHTNICAGYAALKQWKEALVHCNRALELDRNNWRTYNNRAAVLVGLKQFALALTDVNAGLELAPKSDTLHKSLEIVKQHHAAALRDRKRRPTKA
jgi:tetratricopeptide (TPR) repeat protein